MRLRLLAVACLASCATVPSALEETRTVARVIDGDTISVVDANASTRLRWP